MKKKINCLLALLLISGLALSFSSCSDKDVNDTEAVDPSDPYGKHAEDAEALYNFLGAVGSLDSLPNNWKEKNFTVEPCVGFVLDDSNPYVRTIASISPQEAIDMFNGFTGSQLSSDATSGSCNKEGVGSFNLNVINKDGIYATMDINVPQMPHLTQFRFVDQSLMPENDKDQTPYYHIGDVVRVVEKGEASYWVCVRSCNKSPKKEYSYWVSFQLQENNYKTYDATTSTASMIVPDKLGYTGDTDRMLKHTVELFAALSDPSVYDTSNMFAKGLGDLGKIAYSQSMIKAMASQWRANNVYNKVFPTQVIKEDFFNYKKLSGEETGVKDSVFFYVKGHDRAKLFSNSMKLYGTAVYANNDNKIESKNFESKWTLDEKTFNIDTYVQSGLRKWSGVTASDNPTGRTKNRALVVRFKTGAQLCGKSGADPKNYEPLPNNSSKGITITDEFHYDDSKATDNFEIGDIVRDNDNTIWTCVFTPCAGNTNYYFVSTDGIKTDKDDKYATNADLATIDNIYHIYPWLIYMNQQNSEEKELFFSKNWYDKDSYFQLCKYKGLSWCNSNRTTFAIKSSDTQHQHLLRMYYDGADRANLAYNGRTTYMNDANRPIYLEDAADLSLVNKYVKQDTMTNYYWLPDKTGPVYRTKKGNDKVSSYLFHGVETYVNGKEVTTSYIGKPDDKEKDFYSIFMEPVVFMRVKILKPGEGHSFEVIHNSKIEVNKLKGIQEYFIALITSVQKDYVWLNGSIYNLDFNK